MAVVHYKFKNSVEYDSLTFDGLSISLKDLKVGIMKKKKMRAEDNDLQVVNAQTGEVYSSPSLMIPKNTSLIISRIPVGGTKRTKDDSAQAKAQKWAAFRKETQAAISAAETGGFNTEKIKQSSDLVNAQSSEIEKIAEMMKQSTKDFDPSNYTYKFPTGVPNSSYICRKCGKGGHYIQNCTNEPLEGSNSPSDVPRMKRPTGIPVDSMVFVDEPLPGTYQTHSGKYAVPKIDVAAYVQGKKERPPFLPELEKKQVTLKKPIPKELKCPLCGDLAKDAVVIPCCGISYCDDCIRNKLLETEDHVCPSCDSMDVSPDGLIANQMLRRAVTNFQNETGYVKIAQSNSLIKQAQIKAAEAAKAAAAATQVLKMQGPIVPRGPSVLDYKPPPKAPTPPSSQPAPSALHTQPRVSVSTSLPEPMKVNVTPEKSNVPTSVGQEPPTPTQDEPVRSSSYANQVSSSATHNISVGKPLQTLVGQTVQPVNRNQRRPAASSGYDPYYKPTINTAVPPPAVPSFPPTTAFPPPGVPPPFVRPPVLPLVRPPIVPPVVPPVFPAALPPRPAVAVPPINMPKPLSETEFLEEKNRILREELDRKEKDPLLEFAKKLEQRKERSFKSRSRSRSPRPRSRSLSRPRYRSRSRGRSYSRSPRRSYTPRRSSLSPRRSYSPRRYSPRRSRSPRYSPRRYYSPRRSRSPRRSLSPRPRYRSYSRSPVRRRSFSRSRSRDRRRSPFRRSLSRSPLGRRSPFRRSYSRGRYTPPRSLSPYRRSPLRRSRSRGRSPIDQYRRSRSPLRFSPKRKRSPLRRSKSPFKRSPIRRSKSPLKRSPARKMKDKPLSRAKSPKQQKENEKKPLPKVKDRKNSDTSLSDNVNNNKQANSLEPNKENIPSKPVNSRSNNIVINIVDSATTDDNNVVEGKALKADSNQNENAVSNKSLDKTEKSTVELKSSNGSGERENKEVSKAETERKVKSRSRSRSKSKEKSAQSSRQNKPKKKRSPKRKEKSVSLSPERVKSPLRMPYRDRFEGGRGERFDAGRGDRFESGRGRIEGGRDRFEVGRGGYGREWERSRDGDPYYRARQNVGFRGRDYRGRGRGSDFRGGIGDYRGQQQSDFRNIDYRPPPQQQPPGDFGAFPPLPDPSAIPGPYNRDYPQRGSPAYPANYGPNFPYPPPRDPREDPNWQGLVRDEDIVKFEQYKQLYDFYSNSRTYGFPPPPVSSSVPSGQTPPQGPPPAPPGTTPLPTPSERGGSPGRRRSVSPRRHRSRSPRRDGKDRRDREREVREKRSSTERRKDEREVHSPDRKRDYSPEKKHTTDDSRDETSPEKKTKDSDKESKKERKARRKKEKAEGVEKKKKKKKDKEKTKSKKEKAEKKGKKFKAAEQSENEEEVSNKLKLADSQNESDTDKSDSDTENRVKGETLRKSSTAQSDISDQDSNEEKISKKPIKAVVKDEFEDASLGVKKSESDHEEVKPTPVSIKPEIESVEKKEPVKQEKRRSIKRVKPDVDDEQATEAKKAKLEEEVKEEIKGEKMETSDGASLADSEDDIPHPEDELMLDPPELSKWEKWEKDDDPYDLSPEPSKAKEKWKPEKQTFLPRSVIEKAEHALAQKVMKPTSVSSAVSVIQPVKKEAKSDNKDVDPVQSKREKSPVVEPKRRVFMEPDKKKDERRVATKQQHSVKITVTGDEKRKVATGNDLRNKLREKRRENDPPRDHERSRDRDRDRSTERSKRKESHSYKDRRSSRDYERQDSRGSVKDSDRGRVVGRSLSRKESVIDDSRFVPDYDDDESYSEDENSDDSSTDSSSEEEVVQRKHKHKKNKHKKDKKQKKKKEKKKKKNKLEKEKKIKSSIGK